MSSGMTVSVTTDYDATELWSMIMGAAWETWDWWVAYEYKGGDWDKPCTLTVTAWGDDEGEDPALYVTRNVTVTDVATAIGKLATWGMVATHFMNQDFDASSSDCVLQQCVYGEVVYG